MRADAIYDYETAVRDDVRDYLAEHCKEGKPIGEEEAQSLYEDMFVDDAVTGNGSGTYTFDAWEAENYVCHNLDLLGEALDEFGVDGKTLRTKMSGEWADVTIRCLVLDRVLGEMIDEWNENCKG